MDVLLEALQGLLWRPARLHGSTNSRRAGDHISLESLQLQLATRITRKTTEPLGLCRGISSMSCQAILAFALAERTDHRTGGDHIGQESQLPHLAGTAG